MNLEVAGVSTANKGAELMLLAIAEHYAPLSYVHLCVDRRFGTMQDRAQYGLCSKLAAPESFGSRTARVKARIWERLLHGRRGWLAESDIDGVIDASGFAFGDQLGPDRTERFAREVERWKRQGKRVVLLPQALGPFATSRIQASMRRLIDHADLIYARDTASLNFVRQLAPDATNLRVAPDFTCLVKGAALGKSDEYCGGACVVPNYRMMEKMNGTDRDSYIPFLVTCLRQLQRRGLRSYVLLHDSRIDQSLIAPLEREHGDRIEVIHESNPRVLKGLLGKMRVVIGSRFHALVSALSQEVPAIAVGWSHKYEMLLADYGCPGACLSPTSSSKEIGDAIDRVIDDSGLMQARLRQSGLAIRLRTCEMWREVDSLWGIGPQVDRTWGHAAPSR